MKNKVLKIFKIILILLTSYLVVATLILRPQTNVAFQTSDGNWAEQEILFKGCDFKMIVCQYEAYKYRCNPLSAPHFPILRFPPIIAHKPAAQQLQQTFLKGFHTRDLFF